MIAVIFARDCSSTAALVARLRAVAPRIHVLGPGLFACDLAGLEGSPLGHGRRLIAACALGRRSPEGSRPSASSSLAPAKPGLVRVPSSGIASAGIAPTTFVARILALCTLPPAVRVVDDGAGFLAPLPLATLPLEACLVDELRLLGLRSVSDFVSLPRGAVLDRFGRAAAHVHALAAGEEPPAEAWDAPPRRIVARRVFEHDVPDAERLVFLLRVLAEEIAAALADDGIAAVRLRLILERTEGPLMFERTILPPSRDSGSLLRSLRWALEERLALGGVSGAALEVTAVEILRGRQIGLFAPDGARREEALAVARHLRARLGAGAVLRARIANAEARLPERVVVWDEVVT